MEASAIPEFYAKPDPRGYFGSSILLLRFTGCSLRSRETGVIILMQNFSQETAVDAW